MFDNWFSEEYWGPTEAHVTPTSVKRKSKYNMKYISKK